MDAGLARQILAAAGEGGYYDVASLPEEDARAVEEGEYFLAEAKKALENGMNADAILKIVELGGNGSVQDAAPVETGPSAGPAAEALDEGNEPDAGAAEKQEEQGEVERSSSIDRAPLGEKLPVPKEIEGDPSDVPRDLTGLSDREIRRLHSENNAFLARATWVVAVTSSDLRISETMRDNAYRQSLRKIDRLDPDTEKPKLKDVLEAEARDDQDFRTWDSRVQKHEEDLEKLKALKDIYKGHVSALSREASMRSDEFQRAGGK